MVAKPDERQTDLDAYESDIHAWRQRMDDALRTEDGWLTLTGLYWLHEGDNSVGSDPASDVVLPEAAPATLGVIALEDGTATLRVSSAADVLVNGDPVREAVLVRPGEERNPVVVSVGTVNFFVIYRGTQYAVRVRDRNHPARREFPPRQWFPIDPAYRITATFTPYSEQRSLDVDDVIGVVTPVETPGYVEFELGGQRQRLEAFAAQQDMLWLIFKDATAGKQTYGAGRFLYAPLQADGSAVLDFNKAYSPPCAFTAYATCPLPPKENFLSVSIEAGEKA